LVATSTVGIAPLGLAFGKFEDPTPVRPTSKKRKAGDLADVNQKPYSPSFPTERPSTGLVVDTPDSRQLLPSLGSSPAVSQPLIHQRPLTTRVDNNNNMVGRRWSVARHGELSSPSEGEENRRDSVSSKGSWMKRLSTIQISRDNSPRSSIGPDSPSLTFSNGSATPMLPDSTSSPAPLPPNKLVKRVPSGRLNTSIARNRSNTQVPTLRRPATSHQRSITLQQQFIEQSSNPITPRYQTPTKTKDASTPTSNNYNSPTPHNSWRPFFDSRPTKLTKEKSSPMSVDEGKYTYSTSRRVMPQQTSKPILLKPGMVKTNKINYTTYYDEDSFPLEASEGEEANRDDTTGSPLAENSTDAHKRARRSLSMNFSSPSSWVLRSGSLRGQKRNPDGRKGNQRYASAPTAGRAITTANGPIPSGHRSITDPTVFSSQRFAEKSSMQNSRNVSSPLPPLSRLSSFNMDLVRMGLSSSSSSAPRRSPNSPIIQTQTTSTSVTTPGDSAPASPIYFTSYNNKRTSAFESPDRNSTLIGSDLDARGFASGDDDELDFQSETVFDSLRSGATGSMRSHNTQLDAMFDESPPSANGTKNKRLSIHELLNAMRDGNDRILEEDEGMSTPVRGTGSRSSQDGALRTPVRQRHMAPLHSSPPNFSIATKDLSRLSLDYEEDDEDWTRDEDETPEIQSLSLPSSSLNSRKVSPSFRAALADLTQSPSTIETVLPSIERPKSNLFDWSEPSSAEKIDYMGNSPRPKTAHVKQIADGRGGRAIGRRGPNALHIRSQSVPVVPDLAGQREHSKLSTKFGTWGLGGKGVSEEWDGDFEFDGPADDAEDGDSYMGNSGMIVPPAIQASQDHVVGHVGQIREVCLLVEDLKRLRLLAKEKGLLSGISAPLWKEAEGIIALAVPDEEDPTLSPTHSPTSNTFPGTTDDFMDHGYSSGEMDQPDALFEVPNGDKQGTDFIDDNKNVRRRSVFSPEDDIFGAGSLMHTPVRDHLRPPSTSSRQTNLKPSSEYARSVMETMHQHRATSDPQSLSELISQSPNKMPFDTTSLRDLVNRANALSRTLSELIRKSDEPQSPLERSHRDSSPAFTRVFTPTAEAMASPPKHLARSQSNNSMINGPIDSSPTRNLGQRMHMMTVV